ncbi:HAD family hydrolase [Paenibacillus sp. 1A_MP2]|uniref:HAD family hydrolase n=1 Tax=Paenibacillus sp. 1A_MP2 TaxID=3457495 RepID=UPI003FCD4B3A
MKLFATDLDGTLLNRDSQISPENAAAIHKAQQEGLKVTIATGRVYSDVLMISSEGGINTPVIGSNGATIHDANGKRLFHLPLERETAASVMQWLEDHHCYYEASTQQGIYAPISSHEAMLAEMDRILGSSPGRILNASFELLRSTMTRKITIALIPIKKSLPKLLFTILWPFHWTPLNCSRDANTLLLAPM